MVTVGVAGARRNAAAALCDDGRVLAVCEQERLTRTRHVGLLPGALPREAVDTVLHLAGRSHADISSVMVAEPGVTLPCGVPVGRVPHDYAHAATAFHTSPFGEAVVLVCDRHGAPDLSVWRADADGLSREDWPWSGPGFASLYSLAAEALGLGGDGEYRFEALARVADRSHAIRPPAVVCRGDGLDVAHDFQAAVRSLASSRSQSPDAAHMSAVAQAVQHELGQVLLDVVGEVRRRVPASNLCLAGGLFYNSYFNTLLARSGLFERTFVPVNPGNAGVAVGASLAGAPGPVERSRSALSPFLGPGYGVDDIKRTFDNCKLSYDYLRDGQVLERTVNGLAAGKLVGWFQGRMEWGPRALGHRSILASPLAPYVLENLNRFLKHREPYHCYSVAVCEEDVHRYFDGPPTSDFMEFDYDVRDPELFVKVLPLNATRLRVQTVPASAGIFHQLIRAFGDLTGVPVLVNTSFNGFNEPIVCTPRDAVRVFYGTGLDMAVIGNMILRK